MALLHIFYFSARSLMFNWSWTLYEWGYYFILTSLCCGVLWIFTVYTNLPICCVWSLETNNMSIRRAKGCIFWHDIIHLTSSAWWLMVAPGYRPWNLRCINGSVNYCNSKGQSISDYNLAEEVLSGSLVVLHCYFGQHCFFVFSK